MFFSWSAINAFVPTIVRPRIGYNHGSVDIHTSDDADRHTTIFVATAPDTMSINLMCSEAVRRVRLVRMCALAAGFLCFCVSGDAPCVSHLNLGECLRHTHILVAIRVLQDTFLNQPFIPLLNSLMSIQPQDLSSLHLTIPL